MEKLFDYEMCAHVFGGTSSPGCCNYALQRTARGNVSSYSKEATNTLLRNFYVDDVLKSVPSVTDALTLIQEVRDLCKKGGFKLTKFISNKKDILFQIPDALRRDGAKDKNLTGSLPIERALGIFWDAENDVIKFKIDLKDQPRTRRGMLSVISAIYDPLGLACPFLLERKRLLQGLCQVMYGWDEMVTDNICQKWEAWKSSFKGLGKICIRRCIKPEGFGMIKEASLHHFSDASEEGHGQSTCLRLVNVSGKIHWCLLIGKSRVTPKKYMTIPHLELVATVITVKIAALIRR